MTTRISLEKGTLNPQKAAEHIKQYMRENDLNISGMGIECGIDRRVISDICKAKDRVYSLSTFYQIAKRIGYIPDYWRGITDETTENGRRAELERIKQEADYEIAVSEADLQLYDFINEEICRRKDFFHMLGYRYESREGTAYADFAENPAIHELTGYRENIQHKLTDDEFREMLSELQKTVSFLCYKADNK